MRITPIIVALVPAIVAAATLSSEPTHADDAADRALSCVVQGDTVPKADALVYDQGSQGQAIAKLTGKSLPVTIRHFPNPLRGRVKVSTAKGEGHLRIDGWTDRSSFRYFAARDLPVAGSHVWITQGQELDLEGASAKGFTTKLKILGSSKPPVTVPIPCNAVALDVDPPVVEVPERARYYMMRKDSLDLYDEPGGSVVFTLDMQPDTRKLFWSTEARAGYVHVMSRADITIDAWVKYAAVEATNRAEVMDASMVAPRPNRERQLKLSEPPAVLVAERELPIHDKPENRPSPIGFIEVGTRFYAMEQSGDWTNVMPETLAVLPPDGGGFWVRTSGLPKPK
ncbi:MAG: hypothetical protein R3B72_47260 [Polyangiaceae bacterium]